VGDRYEVFELPIVLLLAFTFKRKSSPFGASNRFPLSAFAALAGPRFSQTSGKI
jgi:hypothetical protein